MDDERFVTIITIICFACGFVLGLIIIDTPNELENGCIVHNDKIYCEVVNEL